MDGRIKSGHDGNRDNVELKPFRTAAQKRLDAAAYSADFVSMKSFARTIALALALSAVLLRGLLPAGWMPNAGGGPGLTICTLNGLRHINLSGEPAHTPQHHTVCPFAAAPPLASADAPVLALTPSFAFLHTAILKRADSVARASAYDVHAARAPPILA